MSWRLAYPKASIVHLGTIKSDHTPIPLDTNPQSKFAHQPFKFKSIGSRMTSAIKSLNQRGRTKLQVLNSSDYTRNKPQLGTLFGSGIKKYL